MLGVKGCVIKGLLYYAVLNWANAISYLVACYGMRWGMLIRGNLESSFVVAYCVFSRATDYKVAGRLDF